MKHYFHVTNRYWGKKKLIYPRKLIDFPQKCGISVSPTVDRAIFAAIGSTENNIKKLYVYKSSKTDAVFTPKTIYDWEQTKEQIIVNRCWFTHIHTIRDSNEIKSIKLLHSMLHEYHDITLNKRLFKIFVENNEHSSWNLLD